MVMDSTDKANLFHIIKALEKGNVERDSILGCLGINASTFYKHLNLIKKAGFKIRRDKDVYELVKYKKLFNFAKYEINILTYSLLVVYILLPKKKIENFINVVDKILSMSNKEEADSFEQNYEMQRISTISEYYSEKIAALNKHLNSTKKIIIISKEGKEYHIKPLDFFWQKDKLYLKYEEENSLKNILLDDVVKIVSNQKELQSINYTHSKEIIFELYGKLSKSYLLKEEEKIIDYSRDKIVIASYEKDKWKLFRRLLRYDILCKIIFPKSESKIFKEMIEKALANIGQVTDNN